MTQSNFKQRRTVDKKLLLEYRKLKCVVCLEPKNNKGLEDTCAHHIKSKGSGGPDETFNLMPLCSAHHEEIHKVGTYLFCKKYSLTAMKLLHSLGWSFDDKKLKHPNLSDL
jgi:hypothetical protein